MLEGEGGRGRQDKGIVSQGSTSDCLHIVFSRDSGTGRETERLQELEVKSPSDIRRLRLVALDSSQLGDLARDACSPDRARRQHAQRFCNALTAEAAVPLLCFHHIEELLQHENDGVVARRLSFLRSLPAVAWIVSADGTPGLGTIVDILAAEARAALANPALDAEGVRATARAKLIKVGSGEEAIASVEGFWPVLAAVARARAGKSREIVAITGGEIPAAPDVRVSQLTAGSLRDPMEAQRFTLEAQERLAADIAVRGDRRIADAGSVSGRFWDRVRSEAAGLYAPSANPIIDDLRRRGIDAEDLADDPTVGEVIELIEYRAKLEVVTEACGLDCSGLRSRASMHRIPAWRTECGLRAHGQRRPRNAGGDLTDRHLVCLAPHADLTFVDRRTAEDVRRLRGADSGLAPMLDGVVKVGPYGKVAALLRGLP
jgi:hypothetical protein